MTTYTIYFTFRGEGANGYVQVYDDFCFVNVSREDILSDFTGQFKFTLPDKKCEPYIRNKQVEKEAATLVKAMAAQLR